MVLGEAERPSAVHRRDFVGRLAVRMIGAVIVLLLLAGSIEGFVSTSEGGSLLRLAVSGVSGLFLILYLLNGAMYLRNREKPSPSGPATPRAGLSAF